MTNAQSKIFKRFIMTTNETEPAPLPDTDRHLYLPDTDRHNKSIIKEHTEYFQKFKKAHDEHELALWLEEQVSNYHPEISKSKGMLRNIECHKLFTEFINDPKYSKYFKNS